VLCAGVVEVDESYFRASRPRGMPGKLKRGRGTLKQPVSGVFERGGRVFTKIVPDTNKPILQGLIRGRIALEATVVSGGWCGYDGLVDVGCDRHLRIRKARPKQFSDNGVHINGIESFWSLTKRRLAKFNGVSRNFELHLKECEWRRAKNNDTLNKELARLMVWSRINNLLTVISGNLELLGLYGPTPAPSEELRDAQFAGTGMAQVIQNMLSFAQRAHLAPANDPIMTAA